MQRIIKILGTTVGMGLAVYLASIAVAQSVRQPVATTMTVLPDGRTLLTIHNASSAWLTAYAVVAKQDTIYGWKRQSWLSDSALSNGVAPIAPGSDSSTIVAQTGRHPIVTLSAALFQDGSSFGDAIWVQRLKNARLYSAEAAAEALTDLRELAPSATTPAELVSRLDQQKQARLASLPRCNTEVAGLDRSDRIYAYRSRYATVESMIKGGRCRDVASMVDCAGAVVAATPTLSFSSGGN